MKRAQRRNQNKQKSKKKFLLILFFFFVSVICVAFLYYFNYFPFNNDILAYDRINILAVGTDSEESVARADTILVLSFSPKTKDTILFSIPRDTRVMIPGKGADKVNHAFAYGGIELLKDAIENFMGIPIHYYGLIDFEGFKYIIDSLGGINIVVEKDMYYVDQAGALKINLHRGQQILNGEKALEYVRFRFDPLGDLGRIQRQQKLISAMIDKVMNLESMTKIPSMITSLIDHIDTDMSPNEIIFLTKLMKNIDRSKIWIETIQGEPQYIDGVSYLVADTEKIKNRVKYLIDNKYRGLNVEVLNGNQIPGIAHQVANKMKELGFNIVNIDNADRFDYEKTVLIIYSREIKADYYLEQLGNDVDIIWQEQPHGDKDITIIVGKNMVY